MIGLVLCGGQSTRMGTDKGLLISSKKITWAQQTFSLLSKLEIPVAISVNKSQLVHYKRVFAGGEFILDNKQYDVKGPLLGLLSVHEKYPEEDVFVLACDMVEMDLQVLQYMKKYYQQQNEKEAYVFTNDKFSEPLCAIYKAGGLAKIKNLYENKKLEKHSLLYSLAQLETEFLTMQPEWKPFFSNFNSPKDLKSI